jgi:CheY-like chemotaxis protein
MAEVVSVLSVRAHEKGLQLQCQISGRFPETILSDPARLRQTLTNLVGNAIKFTETGSVKVVGRLEKSIGTQRLAIDVIDTGIGVASDAIGKIFDPFLQADGSVARRFGGTGLGLAISKRFSEMLGGGIRVKSKVGKGSVFTVTIDTGPLNDVRMLDQHQLEMQWTEQEDEEHHAQFVLPACHILVVDDNKANRNLLSLMLQKAGANVQLASNGREAVDLASKGRFDVILMDMQMPIMDGYTATSRLREQGQTLPIIALTGHAMKGDEEKCLRAGCTGYLTKPVKMRDLFGHLYDIVGKPLGHTKTEPTQSGTPRTQSLPKTRSPSSIQEHQENRDPDVGDNGLMASLPERLEPPSRKVRDELGLPTDDAEYFELVEPFVQVLHEYLNDMCRACDEEDYETVAQLAHSIKGSGGTLGYDQFTTPAKQLEQAAKQKDPKATPALIKQLISLSQRMVLPATAPL